MCVHV
jgi:hypothetical protein